MGIIKQRGIALCLSVLSAIAAASPVDEIAVIGTRSSQSAAERPANVAVVGGDALASLAATHVQEALRQIPGVAYQRGNGQESLPAIRSAVLTGAGACGNVMVMEEAISVRSAGFCNVNELFDTHYEQASRIEVTRGASTAFYGSNALLGAINVHLPISVPNSVAIELGPHDYIRAKGSFGYGPEALGRMFVTLTDDGGFRDESGYQQQKLSWRQRASMPGWVVDFGATLTALDQQTAGFISGDGAYLEASTRRQNFDPEAFRKSESARVWARFERVDEHRTLVVKPYLRATQMDFLQHFLPGDPLEKNQQIGLGWQSALTSNALPNVSLSVGLDADFANGELVQQQATPTQGSAFLQATIPTGIHYDYQVDFRQLAIFGHADWLLSDQWRMVAGARLENISYDYNNRGLDGRTRDDGSECGFGGCRYSRPADRKDQFTHLSPKLELYYQASSAWRWHLSLADSFRAPQATELYRLQRTQQVADLDKVRATHAEIGFNVGAEGTSLAVAAYLIDQSNVIIRDADFFNVDGQKIESQGLELQLTHRLNDSLGLRVAASVANHEYASEQRLSDQPIRGNAVDTAPEFVGSAFFDWQANNKLAFELEIHRTSRYYLEPNNRFTYPGHTLFHLRSRFDITDVLSASLRVVNLANKRFAERADFTTFTQQRYFPGEPRSLYGELKWLF